MTDDSFAFFDTLTTAWPTSGCAVSPDVRPPDVNGSFVLDQNYPNPFKHETTVPFTLTYAADVHLNLFDLQGRKVAGVVRKGRSPGPQSIKLNLSGLSLPVGDYQYQLQVSSRHGVFRQSLLMRTK